MMNIMLETPAVRHSSGAHLQFSRCILTSMLASRTFASSYGFHPTTRVDHFIQESGLSPMGGFHGEGTRPEVREVEHNSRLLPTRLLLRTANERLNKIKAPIKIFLRDARLCLD